MSSSIPCPKCCNADTKMIRSVGNFARIFLEALLEASYFLRADTDTYFKVTRKCCECGARFVESRESKLQRKKLGMCVRCGYSLIGNVSGVCPECGWKLTRAQKRFVRKRGTAGQSKDGDANE